MPRVTDLYEMRGPGRDYVEIMGSFKPLSTMSSSAVVPTGATGRGWTVARSGAGVYAIHLDIDAVGLVYASADTQTASADDMEVETGAYTAPTATAKATLALRLYDDADNARTAADMSDDEANRIHFRVVLRCSSLSP